MGNENLNGFSEQDLRILSKRIESLVYSKGTELFNLEGRIEELARFYADTIIKQERNTSSNSTYTQEPSLVSIDIDSINQSKNRSIGLEYVALEAIKELFLDKILSDLSFSAKEVGISIALIVGKLLGNKSERSIHYFLQNTSALDELLGTNFNKLSLSSLYRVQNKLYVKRELIEEKLYKKEKDLFNFEETIILYDLTNTYFEGKADDIAQYGRSKEKRSDCPLITFALCLNQYGFPIKSSIFKGNVSEPKTLKTILESLYTDIASKQCVVFDAGIATKENIDYLREHGYSYIVVSRQKSLNSIVYDSKIDLKSPYKLDAYIEHNQDESYLFIKSPQRQVKEASMMDKFKERFEQSLLSLKSNLNKKHSIKSYNAISQKIGALKNKYSKISRFFTIELLLNQDKTKVVDISWSFDKDKASFNFNGTYTLKTNLTDLNANELYSIYTMLNDVEQTFRILKSDLSLRLIYHRKKESIIAHIFITTLAYHIVHYIRSKLKQKGIHSSFNTIRRQLSTHLRSTISFQTNNGPMSIRKTSKPEYIHTQIYKALGLNPNILKRVYE
jgi:hypothetical protein